MRKRLLSLALVLVMCLSLLPAPALAAAPAATHVPRVDLTLELPIAGQHPDYEGSVPAGAPYTMEVTEWQDVTPGHPYQVMTAQDVYQAKHKYNVSFTVYSKPGYNIDFDTYVECSLPSGGSSNHLTDKGIEIDYIVDYVVPVCAGDVPVNAMFFPDAALREAILQKPEGEDGIVTPREAGTFRDLKLRRGYDEEPVRDLSGLEYLTGLQEIAITGQTMPTLDLRENIYLTNIFCPGNEIKSLLLGENRVLRRLDCSDNLITELDLRGCGRLEDLLCSSTALQKLDLRDCEYLETLVPGIDRSDLFIELPKDSLRRAQWMTSENHILTPGSVTGLTGAKITNDGKILFEGEQPSASFTCGGHKTTLHRSDPYHYTARFEGNGQDAGQPPQPIAVDSFASRYTFPAPGPGEMTKEGHYLSYWRVTTSNGKWIASPGDEVDLYSTRTDCVLTAYWAKSPDVKVSFASDTAVPGTVPPVMKAIARQSDAHPALYYEINIPNQIPEYDGRTFLGWELPENLIGKTSLPRLLQPGQQYFVDYQGLNTQTLYLTAKWDWAPEGCPTREVRYVANGAREGTVPPDRTIWPDDQGQYTFTLATEPIPAAPGREFAGYQLCRSDKPVATYQPGARVTLPSQEGRYTLQVLWNTQKPGTPTLTVTSNSAGKPYLEWTAVDGADHYEVFFRKNLTTEWNLLKETFGTHLTHTSAVPGTSYLYYVVAVNADGQAGEPSQRESGIVPLDTPAPSVSLNITNRPVIRWKAVEGAVAYEVRYSFNGGFYNTLPTVTEPTLTHMDARAGSYRYQVRAIGADVQGSWSRSVSITVPKAPKPVEKLPAPAATVVLNIDDQPVIRWNAVDGAVAYEVRYTSDSGESGTLPAITTTAMVHVDAAPGHTYTYQVRAIGEIAEANSDWGRSASITVPEPDRPQPTQLPTPALTGRLENGKPMLHWDAVPGAMEYEVRYSRSGSDFQVLIVDDTSCYLSSAAPGRYTCQVRAVSPNPALSSEWSRSVVLTVADTEGPQQLSAPTLQATNKASSGKPCLTWSAVDGAARYEVYRATSESGPYSYLWDGTGRSLTNGSANARTSYYYQVRALDADNNPGPWSRIVKRTCDLPRPSVTVTPRSDGKPVLTWDQIDGAVAYEIRYAENGGAMKLLKQDFHGTRLNHTSAKPGHTYTYQVRAIASRSAANSAWSSQDTLTVKAPVNLTAPTLKISNKRSTGKPYLTWNKVSGAARYEVCRAASKSGTYTHLWDGTGTALTNGSAKTGTTYYYRVRAIAADGTKGPWSTIQTRTCDLAQPNVKLTVRSDGKPVLTWQKVSGAVEYQVYRRTDGGDFSRLATVKGTKLTNTSAKSGHTYTYRVRAIASRSAANSAYSYEGTITVK